MLHGVVERGGGLERGVAGTAGPEGGSWGGGSEAIGGGGAEPVVGCSSGTPANEGELDLEAVAVDVGIQELSHASQRLEVGGERITEARHHPVALANEGAKALEAFDVAHGRLGVPRRALHFPVRVVAKEGEGERPRLPTGAKGGGAVGRRVELRGERAVELDLIHAGAKAEALVAEALERD